MSRVRKGDSQEQRRKMLWYYRSLHGPTLDLARKLKEEQETLAKEKQHLYQESALLPEKPTGQ